MILIQIILYMSLTVVSCYYEIPNKHSKNLFYKWFETTLQINCPYIIFTSQNLIPIILNYRKGLPTHCIVYKMEEFYTYKYKDRMNIHPTHCPSVELNLIWNEKMNMIHKAYELNIFNSDWFIWIDAGISTFRNKVPPTQSIHTVRILEKLPHNRCIYTSSNPYISSKIRPTNYYHHISGTFMIHKDILSDFTYKYYWMLEAVLKYRNIWTDQLVMTHMYKKWPYLFFKLADGYGEIIKVLYS